MHKAAPCLLFVVSILMASSRARAEVFYSTYGPFGPPTVAAVLNPEAPLQAATITGLQPSETSLGVAVRPATGELYLVGSTGRLYRLSPATGAATLVGSPFSPSLSGTEFSIAFDNSDRLRIVSDTGQNLRINPTTAAVTVDTPLAFAAGDPHFGQTPRIGAIAYDHRNGSATAYGIDDGLNVLVRLGAATASDGVLTTIASNVSPLVGFDISTASGVAYGLEPGFTPELVTVDLATGGTTPLAAVGNQFTLFRGLAVAPAIASVPTLDWRGLAGLALVLALSGFWLVRRRAMPHV